MNGQVATMSALFPTYNRFPVTVVKGKGSKLWDDQGNEYLDFTSGIAVTNLGHSPEPVRKRLAAQLDQLWHVSNLFHIPTQEKLGQLLSKSSGLDAVFFCNSGAEANEAAIKLVRRYYQSVRGQKRNEIITFRQSFHGRTLATLTATGQDKVKEGFMPLPEGFVYAEWNNADSLNDVLSARTCAVMMELVQGEGGVNPANPSFVKQVAQFCKQHDLLLIIDEIQTGMGRTGSLFAYQQYGIKPDIITLAKGLGSGFPIGAMLGTKPLIEAFSAGSHGSTFGGNPLAVTAGLATLEYMLEQKLPEKTFKRGNETMQQLRKRLSHLSWVKDVRGMGFLIGIACDEPVAELVTALRKKGLLVVTAGPNVLRLLPSLLITDEELQQGLDIIVEVLSNWKAEGELVND